MDITAAHQQEAELRASETRYQELATRLPLGVYIYRNNAAGEVAYDYYSPQAGRLIGADPAEVLRNPFAAVATIHPDDLPGMLALSEETRAAGVPFRWEGRFVVDGDERRIRIEALPTPLPDGWTRWHGIADDVTERRRAEDALRASEERYRFVVEHSSDIISVVANDGTVTWTSPSIETVLGWRPDQIVGHQLSEFSHPDDATVVSGFVTSVQSRRADRQEVRARTATGDWRTLDVQGEPILDEAGTVTGRVTTSRDITARAAAEAALAARQEQLRATLEGVDAVVVYQRSAADPVTVSPQAERILGWPQDRVGDQAFWNSLVHPDDLPNCTAVWRGPADDWELEYRMRRPDGAWMWVLDRGHRTRLADGSQDTLFGVVVDVTARRQADEELRRLVTAVEQSDDSIVVTDINADILFVNPAFERRSGYQRSEAAGRNPRFLQSGRRSPAFYREMWATLSAGRTWRGELENRHRDGSIYLEDATITPVHGAGGEIVNYVAVKRDITAQKAAQAELARLVAAVDQTAESVVVTDVDANIVYVNPEFERNTGWTREEAIGHNPRLLQSGVHGREFYEEMWATLTAGRVWRGELHNRRKDGSVHLEATTITPVVGADGRLESYVAVKRDVTEERRAAAVIRASEERYRTLVDEIDAIVWINDRKSGDNYCSGNAADMVGYPVEQLLQPRFWRSLVVPEDLEVLFPIWDTEDPVAANDLPYRVRRADGRIIWVSERWRAVRDEEGQVVRLYGLTTEITRRRQLEDTVARADRLEAVARVTAAAAHDFGNVLQGIRLYQGLLMDRIPATDPAAADVAAIGEAVERGSALARQMLAIGREAPKTDAIPLDPAAVIADLAAMLRAVASPSRLDVAAAGMGFVRIPRSALEQAVLNLVINARDAMAAQPGTITLTMTRETVAPGAGPGVPGGVYIAIRVADDGPGMPSDVLEHALEPFYTTKAHGTGIGLASVYGSARDADGTVHIESSPGAGTTVTILLPWLEGPSRGKRPRLDKSAFIDVQGTEPLE
ncbi:MAG: PAS domain S-box protein, partial [Chloroflexota bacterium]